MLDLKKLFSVTLMIVLFVLFFMAGCKKEEEEVTLINETGTMTDIDGNIYKTVKIGNQWWMAENLNVKKYRNGNSIQHHSGLLSWGDSSAAWCSWNDENNTVTDFPGLLYNWYAVSDTSMLAPVGWHIPTDDEWKELERNLGMNSAEADNVGWRGNHLADKLKMKSPHDWTTYSNVWSTNESGFTALAGGCRLFDARWSNPGLHATGYWWTLTERSQSDAWYRYLDYKNSDVFRSHCSKDYGFSVRCIKDN